MKTRAGTKTGVELYNYAKSYNTNLYNLELESELGLELEKELPITNITGTRIKFQLESKPELGLELKL